MKRSLILLATMCLVLGFAGGAMADSVEWTTHFPDLNAQTQEHDDVEPFKGSALVYAYNDTNDYWTDFHFEVFSVSGSNISATIFVEGDGLDPSSSQGGLTWTIDNDPAGAKINLYFASDPVAPGSLAWFKVYTDNTTYKQRFGLSIYPTIPEPSSILAFASGLVGLAGFALRRKS